MKGLWKLAWVETKVFLREPMGAIGSLALPIVVLLLAGRAIQPAANEPAAQGPTAYGVTVFASLFIAIGAVLSLVAIMAIYREGGILKRLRATPLSPMTILSAHVLVKLATTVLTLAALVAVGRRTLPGAMDVNLLSFGAALLLGTLSILSVGFLVASIVPTARFAQPIGAAIFYPMVAFSGLFFPVTDLPFPARAISHLLPTTHTVSLLRGIGDGSGWSGHWPDVLALLLVFVVCTAASTKAFRWE